MTIATATFEDVDALVELLQLLFEQETEFTPDRNKQRAGLHAVVAAPANGRILLWRESGTVAGMVGVLFTISTAEGGKAALLEDMIVHPQFRGRGIGSQLLAAAVELCAAEHCTRITLLTDRSNTAAVRFYSRQGFQLSSMLPMRLQLV